MNRYIIGKRKTAFFRNYDELEEFIKIYFRSVEIDTDIAIEAGKIKIWGDKRLSSASVEKLKRRRLSVCDAFSIAIAKKYGIPIITGDLNLAYVARLMGIKIIW